MHVTHTCAAIALVLVLASVRRSMQGDDYCMLTITISRMLTITISRMLAAVCPRHSRQETH
jgi:hypothetical protein